MAKIHNALKYILAPALLLAAFLLNGLSAVYADDQFPAKIASIISSVTRLDLKQGTISGDKAYYVMTIPDLWQTYLVADREKPAQNGSPLEKLTFYYQPQDNMTKPVTLLNIAVYDKHNYASDNGYAVFLETERYYFTYSCPSAEKLPTAADQAIFDQIVAKASDDMYLSALITLPSDDDKIFTETIWVNGSEIRAQPLIKNGAIYLPVRAVCEALGYKVGWKDANRAISLSNMSGPIYLFADHPDLNHGYAVIMQDDRAYVSTLYFMTQLNLNVRVDERENVNIY
ncbi:MAG: copper amine oxidase N-terminal domain-containing protein [Defluviitaleaceae bacterium]|nr:copper amine oxidase N-terminal domain-containing protein [Defluviitaleaceae bacterium]